ncbi:MAG: alpha/beta fold hydrolase, partial [Pseudomonadota bacterium]
MSTRPFTRPLAAALAASALALATHTPALTADATTETRVGMAHLSVPDPTGERALTGWVWYPTASDAREAPVLGNPVWAAVDAVENAVPAGGAHPVLLVSHGMYGNTRNQAWLARRLAQRGYLVAAVNHPGTTTRDRRPSESRKLWERPRDLSRLLDALLASPHWRGHVDADRIAAAGHSLGGLTVMRLAGALGDNARHRRLCAADPSHVDCQALSQLNIGHAEDTARLAESNRDPRVRAVVSMDLGGTQSLDQASLEAITVPVLVMGASRGEQIDQARESRALAARLPEGVRHRFDLPDVGHFDYLGVCTDIGLAILRDEEPEDAVVCERGTAERDAKH